MNKQQPLEKEALDKILKINPQTDSEEINEWAEAECFHKAQGIAYDALKKPIEHIALRMGLQRIVDLDRYTDSNEPNEWGESECFYKALKIAKETLLLNMPQANQKNTL